MNMTLRKDNPLEWKEWEVRSLSVEVPCGSSQRCEEKLVGDVQLNSVVTAFKMGNSNEGERKKERDRDRDGDTQKQRER